MNEKLATKISKQNIALFIITIFAIITFIMQLYSALLTIEGGGVLNSVNYTIFGLKINVTREPYNSVYIISNYPLIPILGALIYNTYIIIKNHKVKNTVVS